MDENESTRERDTLQVMLMVRRGEKALLEKALERENENLRLYERWADTLTVSREVFKDLQKLREHSMKQRRTLKGVLLRRTRSLTRMEERYEELDSTGGE